MVLHRDSAAATTPPRQFDLILVGFARAVTIDAGTLAGTTASS
jgi:hypothetical protein